MQVDTQQKQGQSNHIFGRTPKKLQNRCFWIWQTLKNNSNAHIQGLTSYQQMHKMTQNRLCSAKHLDVHEKEHTSMPKQVNTQIQPIVHSSLTSWLQWDRECFTCFPRHGLVTYDQIESCSSDLKSPLASKHFPPAFPWVDAQALSLEPTNAHIHLSGLHAAEALMI